uniref:Histone deacetylase 2-like n=1 Tax=Saccoglossus kowalevskii TaxID=10224 RepID=A0ABM0MFE6_SACKO
MRKFERLYQILLEQNVICERQVLMPVKASKDLLTEAVHTKDYIEDFFNGWTDEKAQRKTGFVWSEGLVSRCRYETGGTVLTAEAALQCGLACSTAGGTHHAFPAYGAGYCLFNDIAVAAKYLILRNKVSRVLVIDLDVHQGDGTAFIFKDDPAVFTFSVHCGKNFPLFKQQSDLDISLNCGTGNADYMDVIQHNLPWIFQTFRPDLVIYDAGVDPHKEDLLGQLALTDEGLFKRDYWVINYSITCGCPCACLIGGGYDKSVDKLALRHSILHRAATK